MPVSSSDTEAYRSMRAGRLALDIEKNQSVALTASASQVRRPIYGSSSVR